MDFSICGILGQLCGKKTRQDIEKRFSVSLKGVDNQAFPVKNLAFRIFIFNLCHFQNKTKHFYGTQ